MDLNRFIEGNLQFYQSIRPKYQPKSYTVLATLNDYATGQLIALASGTQANLKLHADDIQDCHAESLLKRAYKRYLLDRLKSNGDVNNQELILFITKFPCGLLKRYLGDEPINEETGSVIIRKPGRGLVKDGKVQYVEKPDCLHKLIRWTNNGFQGEKIKRLFGFTGPIRRLLIGDCETEDNFDYQSSLEDLKGYIKNCDVELIRGVRSNQFIYASDKQPQPESVVFWSCGSNLNKNCEYIIDGRKRGLTKRLLDSDKEDYKLKIGNYWLDKDATNLKRCH